jgi:N-acetylneuraminic acid mutarotase
MQSIRERSKATAESEWEAAGPDPSPSETCPCRGSSRPAALWRRVRQAITFAIAVAALHGSSARAQTGEWAWMSGSNTGSQLGVYGTLGVPTAANVPGVRHSAVSWKDPNGNFWLFGGFGMDANGSLCARSAMQCELNDLWKYNPSTGEWTWMSGSSTSAQITGGTIGQPGVYGTPGVAAAGNVPGGRGDAVSWTDSSGNLWLFGGYGMDASGSVGNLNDLWKYTPSSGEWAWMGGSNSTGQPGVYGTLGVPAAPNVPGARRWAVGWADPNGNLWLFGGFGNGELNDLWKYAPSTGEWTWMSGSEISGGSGVPGVYGMQGVPAAGNVPGQRYGALSWIDPGGNLWLFGGFGVNASGLDYYLNDLWEYSPPTGEWAWMSGSDSGDQPGVYGTPGTPAAGNVPAVRSFPVGWTDLNGNLWLFGGCNAIWMNSPSGYGCLNDLWEYMPSTGEWTWMSGSGTKEQPGVYGLLGVPAAGNVPGARVDGVSWTGSNGDFWLFGGSGFDANGKAGDLNDLWRYTSNFAPAAAAPTFNPPAGTYSSAQSVTISDATAGATIYYTTNGVTPTTSSSVYAGAIPVSSSETIEAIAVVSGYSNSAVAAATYTINYPAAATPTFNPPAGTYTSAQSVAISDPIAGATIYYTTNGTTPTTSSSVYAGAIPVASSETIEAIAVVSGYSNSAVASATYTINYPAAATPTFNPRPGTYTSAQSVTISDATAGATIYYTTNGTTPTTSSSVYPGAFSVTSSETVQAMATAPGFLESSVAVAAYTINLPTPSFALSLSKSALTVDSGTNGVAMLTVTPENGFNSTVTLNCSGLPSGVTCSFDPATVTPSGSVVTAQMTIAQSAQGELKRREFPWIPGSSLAFAVIIFAGKRGRSRWPWAMIAAATLGSGLLCGCSAQLLTFTIPHTSTVTVVATSGTVQRTASLALTVK